MREDLKKYIQIFSHKDIRVFVEGTLKENILMENAKLKYVHNRNVLVIKDKQNTISIEIASISKMQMYNKPNVLKIDLDNDIMVAVTFAEWLFETNNARAPPKK